MARLVLVLSLLLLHSTAVLAAEQKSTAILNKEIDKLVALYTDGLASSQSYRHLLFGAIFDEESADAVAFFVLPGIDLMNGYEEYIAVFAQGQGRKTPVSKEKPYRLIASAQIGTRWARTLDWKSARVSQGQIIVQGMRWDKADAGCCPTKPIEVTFRIAKAVGGETSYPLLTETETAR